MAKGYWIVAYRSVSNPAALKAYSEVAAPALNAAGGRVLARAMPAKTFEHGLQERIVVIEFGSVAAAVAAYESDAYKAALQVLANGAERDIRIVEGS